MAKSDAPAVQALAVAVCRWHHAHYGSPIPCVHSVKEAQAISGLLDHAGYGVVDIVAGQR